jgi:hypothetical protein
MNKKLRNLAERRESLVAEAAAQRLLIAQNIETWRTPLGLADRGLAAVSYIKSHPVWRGWIVWQVVRKLRNKL